MEQLRKWLFYMCDVKSGFTVNFMGIQLILESSQLINDFLNKVKLTLLF